MMENDIDEIMIQIQEFASQWSLVGGRFDDGSMLEKADASRDRIRAILESESKNEIAVAKAALDVAANFVDPLDWPLARRIRNIDPKTIIDGMP